MALFRMNSLSAALLLCSVSMSYGLGSEIGPDSIKNERSLTSSCHIPVPSVDVEAALREDEKRANGQTNVPLRFAEPIPLSLSSEDFWNCAAGDNTYAITVESPGAQSINIGFDVFDVPKGVILQIRDLNAGAIETYTQSDATSNGELWTDVIPTDTISVEVEVPPHTDLDQVRISTESLNAGYIEIDVGVSKSGGCNIDVVCPLGDDWDAEIRSVARYTRNGIYLCSGAMINNVRQDQTPLFLTAAHCGINSNNAGSIVTYWNYETSTCGGRPDGSLNQRISGATYLAGTGDSSSDPDQTLLLLDGNPPPEWRVTFSGWDSDPARASDEVSAVCIHHPSGDEKRISYDDDALRITNYGSGRENLNGKYIRIGNWEDGTTEGGSSGSPLYGADHRIIGQLTGGSAACWNNFADWYGRFAVGWTESGLAEFLDPDGDLPANGGIDTLDPYAVPSAPTPTAPTPTPVGDFPFTILIQLDSYPQETGWSLIGDDGTVYANYPIGSYAGQIGLLITETHYLISGTRVTLTILDEYGDGICCSWGQGFVEIYLGEEANGNPFYYNNGQFGDDLVLSGRIPGKSERKMTEMVWTQTETKASDGKITDDKIHSGKPGQKKA